MACSGVRRVATGDIGHLVTRLERHGPQTAKMRCFLLLIHSGVNDFEHWIYASEEDPVESLVAVLITLSTPDLLVVDVFAADDPASHGRLSAALLSPAVSARLWQPGLRLRVICWPNHLRPVLEQTAQDRGYSVTQASTDMHMFIREADRDDTELWPELSVADGVIVGPLSLSHLAKVKQHWQYLRYAPDAEAMMHQSVKTGLSAGVFLQSSIDSSDSGHSSSDRESKVSGESVESGVSAESGVAVSGDSAVSGVSAVSGDSAVSGVSAESGVSAVSGDSAVSGASAGSREDPPATLPADRLVSWMLVNTYGHLGYAHTLEAERRRGYARLALAELVRRCSRRRLPAVVATALDNHGMMGAMRPLGFTAVGGVFWAAVTPPPPPPGPQLEQREAAS